jgi:hypothetical protein
MEPNSGSKSLSMSRQQWLDLAVNTGKVALAAGVTYLLQWASGHDWGDYKGFVVTILAGATDLLHKWLPDNRK